MKIKQKSTPTTTFGKRQTPISVFAFASIIPLFISFIMGLNLGSIQKVNESKLDTKISALTSVVDSLNTTLASERKIRSQLHTALLAADSTFEQFRSKDLESLQEALATSRDEYEVRDWEHEFDDAMHDFKSRANQTLKLIEYEDDFEVQGILDLGIEWLTHFTRAKENEMFARKLMLKHDRGEETSSDYEKQIETLEQRIAVCEEQKKAATDKNTILNLDLRSSEERLAEISERSQFNVSDKDKTIRELQVRMETCLESSKLAKGNIANHIQNIEKELLNLEGQKFLTLKNDQKEINQLKERIKIILNSIRSSTQDL